MTPEQIQNLILGNVTFKDDVLQCDDAGAAQAIYAALQAEQAPEGGEAVCACGHSVDEHSDGGCLHIIDTANDGCCHCRMSPKLLAQQAGAEVVALRARVKELETALEACFNFMSLAPTLGIVGLAIVENARNVLENKGGAQ